MKLFHLLVTASFLAITPAVAGWYTGSGTGAAAVDRAWLVRLCRPQDEVRGIL